MIGLLGILAAGGAYLPLDPAHPAQRLAQLREEAGVRVVVTRAAFAAAAAGGAVAVEVDAGAAAVAAESDARPESGARPQHLAYVLFTSGSTGKPKGVAVEHRNLVSYLRGVGGRLALPEGASYAHVSTLAADLGNTVLFPPLCSGGVLHLIPEALTTDPDGLGAYFQREGVDCLKIVPSHLSALLVGRAPGAGYSRRKLLVLGGEGVAQALVRARGRARAGRAHPQPLRPDGDDGGRGHLPRREGEPPPGHRAGAAGAPAAGHAAIRARRRAGARAHRRARRALRRRRRRRARLPGAARADAGALPPRSLRVPSPSPGPTGTRRARACTAPAIARATWTTAPCCSSAASTIR